MGTATRQVMAAKIVKVCVCFITFNTDLYFVVNVNTQLCLVFTQCFKTFWCKLGV